MSNDEFCYLEGSSVRDIKPTVIAASLDIAEKINSINLKLEEISEALKLSQPKGGNGCILLYFKYCSKNCLGCPHPVWKVWIYRRSKAKKGEKIYLSHTINNPLQRIKTTGDFEDSYVETRELIRDAVGLIEKRKKIINSVKAIKRIQIK